MADRFKAMPVDGTDGQTLISGADAIDPRWRTYTKIVVTLFNDPVGVIWTNMPAAITEFLGTARHRTTQDLTYCTQWRLRGHVGSVAGVAGSDIGVQYSLDGGTNWFGLDNGTADIKSTVDLDVTNTDSDEITAWTTIIAAGRVDVLLRIVGLDGDGAVDPVFHSMEIQFR